MTDVADISAGRVRLRAGTLYAALDRLTGEHLVEADREEVVDGRLRRYYRLTPAGGQRLAAEVDRLQANAAVAARGSASGPARSAGWHERRERASGTAGRAGSAWHADGDQPGAGLRAAAALLPRRAPARHADEMLGVLMAGAVRRRRPGLADSADLIGGALRIRLRAATTGSAGQWREALGGLASCSRWPGSR